jgi:hypothetical protein
MRTAPAKSAQSARSGVACEFYYNPPRPAATPAAFRTGFQLDRRVRGLEARHNGPAAPGSVMVRLDGRYQGFGGLVSHTMGSLWRAEPLPEIPRQTEKYHRRRKPDRALGYAGYLLSVARPEMPALSLGQNPPNHPSACPILFKAHSAAFALSRNPKATHSRSCLTASSSVIGLSAAANSAGVLMVVF